MSVWIAQQVKAFDAKPANLSLSPGTVVGGELIPASCPLSSTRAVTLICPHTQ